MWRVWEEGTGRESKRCLDTDRDAARHVTGKDDHSNMITNVQEQGSGSEGRLVREATEEVDCQCS